MNINYPTPSVFHADQRGMLGFWIRTLRSEFWGHPQPHGEPQHQQGQGLIFREYFIEETLLVIVKLVI